MKNAATIDEFYNAQTAGDRAVCDALRSAINAGLPAGAGKIWHRHPVGFLGGNPTVGYSKLKDCIRLMFWSGADFEEPALKPGTGKFKDASIRYTHVDQFAESDLYRWPEKSQIIQWDYKNIYKRKGQLRRIV